MTNIPRPEYPRPQMVRLDWMNLNGQWEFEFDFGISKKDINFQTNGEFTKKITVPFCPESELSGIGYKDFMNAVWYKRTFELTSDWTNELTIIHFGAVDYITEVYINNEFVGKHIGGYSSFSFDISRFVKPGENTVVVYAVDDNRRGEQPRGKQSEKFYSHTCDYTRTTGIWQTVWLEKVPKSHIKSFKVYPNVDSSSVDILVDITYPTGGAKIKAATSFEGRPTGEVSVDTTAHSVMLHVPLSEKNLWEVGNGRLYDLTLTLENAGITDTVESYFGLRSVSWDNRVIYINNKPVFQRLVLDQGYYPDGIYTASTDEALKKDIELSMALGFNGARMHEKIFEERFIYWADKMGYIVWGEHANWGLNIGNPSALNNFLPEWIESMNRDFNHPAIVGWCPFNETWDVNGQRQHDGVLYATYHATKAIDPTRPVIDTSGNFHVVTDIFDIHDYEQNVEKWKEKFEPMKNGGPVHNNFPDRQKHVGQPYFMSEYGGSWWSNEKKDGWGYGNAPKTQQELAQRYAGLTGALLDNPNICALCYTQLYDVEQEQNGLYTYDRKRKFTDDVYDIIIAANTKKAAIEE